jgi:hypothetical protein
MIRKMLLVGCKVGPWVPTAGMDMLSHEIRVRPAGRQVRVDHLNGFIRAVAECDEVEDLLVEIIG